MQSVTVEQMQIRCSVNPTAGREIDFLSLKPGKGTIVVIGAGPAGIQAALTSAKRGFDVLLTDKASEIGGALQLANKAPGKFRIDNLINYYKRQIDKSDKITLRLNYEITRENLDELAALNPYAVVLASGGKPIVPRIPGVEKAVVAHNVLSGVIAYKNKNLVVIGGGMTGLETAELLAESGNRVTVLEMLPTLGKGIFSFNATKTISNLKKMGVDIKTCHRLDAINDDSASVVNTITQEPGKISCDAVVLAIGVVSENSLRDVLEARFNTVIQVGDCSRAGKIVTATREGHDRVWYI